MPASTSRRTARQSPIARHAVSFTGEGPPIMLVHGYGCDQTMWNRLTPYLEGHQVIAYDLAGMGYSDPEHYSQQRHGTLEGHADDLVELLDAIESEPVVLIGHSVSAMIAAHAAIKRPERVAALVMITPNPCYIDDPPYRGGFTRETIDGLLEGVKHNYSVFSAQLAGMVAGPDEPKAALSLEHRFCKNDPIIARHFAEVTFLADTRELLPQIQAPTLVLDASDDPIAITAVGDYVESQIPEARRATVACHGHAPHITRPRETSAAVLRFLATCDLPA